MKEFLAAALDFILCRITIFITGVRPPRELLNIGEGSKIYYANHASHGDFLLIFVSLPYRVRKRVRPVAAAEYWESGPVRRFLAKNVFNMVLISRHKDPLEAHPAPFVKTRLCSRRRKISPCPLPARKAAE